MRVVLNWFEGLRHAWGEAVGAGDFLSRRGSSKQNDAAVRVVLGPQRALVGDDRPARRGRGQPCGLDVTKARTRLPADAQRLLAGMRPSHARGGRTPSCDDRQSPRRFSTDSIIARVQHQVQRDLLRLRDRGNQRQPALPGY
jgi:hypothetical protein